MRFVALCIAPAVILGILPFAESIPAAYTVAIWIVSLVMTVGAVGDFANIYNTIKQVPRGAKVFNYGMDAIEIYALDVCASLWGRTPTENEEYNI